MTNEMQQTIALALSKSISATLSLIASSILIYKIYLRYSKSRSQSTVTPGSLRSFSSSNDITTYHRMLLSISILDVIHSTSAAFSSLLVPSYTNGIFAHGTTATCSMQAALQQLTPTIIIYMAMLNTYFMMKIRYNVSDSVIHQRYEVWLHAIPIGHFACTVIIGLSLGIFGPMVLPELGCWLDSYCVFTNTCTRSSPIFYNHLDVWLWSYGYIWLFICLIIVIINGILIFTAIRSQEKRNEKYFVAKLLLQSEAAFTHTSTQYRSSGSSSLQCQKPPSKRDGEVEIPVGAQIDETEESGRSRSEDIVTQATSHKKLCQMRMHQQQQTHIKQSRIAAVQSMLYVASALFTAFWMFMPWVSYKLNFGASWRFIFFLMLNVVSPSQGVFNLLLYVRQHYLRLREKNTNWNRWKCAKTCLFSSG